MFSPLHLVTVVLYIYRSRKYQDVPYITRFPVGDASYFTTWLFHHKPQLPWPVSVVVERSPGMQEVGGSIPGCIKQKTLKFEVLLLCLALSINELETDWLAQSQDNGLGWDITAYPWRRVSVG